jgi:dTDP-4-amino-4,6-dideoxygalactose transaminase
MNFIDLKTPFSKIKLDVYKRFDRIFENAEFINGKDVKEFEESSSKYLNYKYCIGVSSGTDALMVSMMSLGVNSNTKVFLPAFTYTATAEVICLLGATPVFVDVSIESCNIDINSLNQSLKEHAKPNDIILPVDLFGLPADYDEIVPLSKKYNCKIIIDGAQSFGNEYKGKKNIDNISSFCTSFFPAKPLGCSGDGGAIYTDNEEFALTCRSIKNHGMGKDKYDIKRIGLNARLDTLQAAYLIEKLKFFDEEVNSKIRIYEKFSNKIDLLTPLKVNYESKSACAQAVFKLPEKINNFKFKEELSKKHIPSMIYYPKTVADQTAYNKKSIIGSSLNNSKKLTNMTIALPFHSYLSQEEIEKITDSSNEILNSL